MKVYIGDYKHPYTVFFIETILNKFMDDDTALQLTLKISRNKTVKRILGFINSLVGDRDISVRIDRYDHWNAFETLAIIALPLLKELQKNKLGSPIVDDSDIPEYLRVSDYKEVYHQHSFDFGDEESSQYCQQTIHDKWNWVLGEIIWAFEQLNTDWESQFYGTETLLTSGYYEHSSRIQRGLELFGKYYQNLWD